MKASEISPKEYNPYYQSYVAACGESDLIELFDQGLQSFTNFIKSIPEDKLQYRYEEGKWTVGEVLIHLFDTERIFQYRALRFARNDRTPLPGFDQDDYVLASFAEERSLPSILNEYTSIRKSTITLFQSFSDKDLLQVGQASGSDMSVRALGFIINGHQKHHQNILIRSYGL